MDFRKLLVANRGEIAARVLRTAKAMGYQTVAVYSQADADAPHVSLADQAVCIGPAEVGASYLSLDKIIEAARRTGADAIHPGYGFLSENAAFVRACEEAGICFVGPPASAMELMGNKRAARKAMEEAGVPCVPGYEGDDQSLETLAKQAEGIGYPILLKAAMGGGGRGMRIVESKEGLADAIRAAQSEAQNAFGDGSLLMERALMGARHIEIQVFADSHGNAIHLGERDCSVQRRYQKVIEEAPSPAVDAALRERMGKAAVMAAQACDYTNAGTVEFLLDDNGDFFFLEMNTRLQVEHPVTECVTGLDLVEWQLRVARGEALPLKQEQVELSGHSIEVRLYAEDPSNNYFPQTGTLHRWAPPPGARVDAGVRSGSVVTPHYDPMIAKLIVYADDRASACRKMRRALYDTHVLGLKTNRAQLSAIFGEASFLAGEATTQYLSQVELSFEDKPEIALAGLLLYLQRSQSLAPKGGWLQRGAPQSIFSLLRLTHEGTPWNVAVYPQGTGDLGGALFEVRAYQGDQEPEDGEDIEVAALTEQSLVAIHRGIRSEISFACDEDTLYMEHQGASAAYVDISAAPPETLDSQGSGQLRALMDGAIMEIFASVGERVSKGQTLLVMDAMKMEHPLKSDIDGVVQEIRVKAGAQVKNKQLLVVVASDEAKEG